MARCSWPIVATNVGPSEQPEDVFEDILEDMLERLVATQMPEDAPTGNFHLGFGWTHSVFCLREREVWDGCVFLFGNNRNTEHGIYVHYQGRGCLCYNLGLIWDWE